MMPPLLPPVAPAAPAWAQATDYASMAPAPAPANTVAHTPSVHADLSATVEMPVAVVAAPAISVERPVFVPARSASAPRRVGLGRFSGPLLRRSASPRAADLLPPAAELTRIEDIRRPFRRPMTVLVANPKGGSGKTPLTLMLAGTLALMRGGHVLAWDNNEARGGLADRANPRAAGEGHGLTVRHLLNDLPMFESHTAGMGELAGYLRPQDELFDVLASDDDPAALRQIRAADFTRLHAVLRRYYRILILDSGNNVRSEAWQSAAAEADCLVLASNYDPDSIAAADWTLEHLDAIGRSDLVDRAVAVLTASSGRPDPLAQADAQARFARTAAVIEIAHDPTMCAGGRVGRSVVSEATTKAVITAARAVVEQLCAVDVPAEKPNGLPAEDVSPAFERAADEAIAMIESTCRVSTNPAPTVSVATVAPATPAKLAKPSLSLVEAPTVQFPKTSGAKVVAATTAAPRATASVSTRKSPVTKAPASKAPAVKDAAPKAPAANATAVKAPAPKTPVAKATAPKVTAARKPAAKAAVAETAPEPATTRTRRTRTEPSATHPTLEDLVAQAAILGAAVEEIVSAGAGTAQVTGRQKNVDTVIAPRSAKEPKSTRRIAKPRTDAPVSDTPPVTDAPVTGAAPSGEVVSADVPLLRAVTTAAGLPAAVGRRS